MKTSAIPAQQLQFSHFQWVPFTNGLLITQNLNVGEEFNTPPKEHSDPCDTVCGTPESGLD